MTEFVIGIIGCAYAGFVFRRKKMLSFALLASSWSLVVAHNSGAHFGRMILLLDAAFNFFAGLVAFTDDGDVLAGSLFYAIGFLFLMLGLG